MENWFICSWLATLLACTNWWLRREQRRDFKFNDSVRIVNVGCTCFPIRCHSQKFEICMNQVMEQWAFCSHQRTIQLAALSTIFVCGCCVGWFILEECNTVWNIVKQNQQCLHVPYPPAPLLTACYSILTIIPPVILCFSSATIPM